MDSRICLNGNGLACRRAVREIRQDPRKDSLQDRRYNCSRPGNINAVESLSTPLRESFSHIDIHQ